LLLGGAKGAGERPTGKAGVNKGEPDSLERIATELGLSAESLESLPEAWTTTLLKLRKDIAKRIRAQDYKAAHVLQQEMRRLEQQITSEVQRAVLLASPGIRVSRDGASMPSTASRKRRSVRATVQTKIVLLGHQGAGKTSFFADFIHSDWEFPMKGSLGSLPRFARRRLAVEGGVVTVILWDTPGVHTHAAVSPVYYQDADAIIVLFDASLGAPAAQQARTWVRHLRKRVGSLPIALCAAKADLDEEAAALWAPLGLNRSYPDLMAPGTHEGKHHVDQVNGTNLCFAVSSKRGEGVAETIEAIVDVVIRREGVLGYQVKPSP